MDGKNHLKLNFLQINNSTDLKSKTLLTVLVDN